MLTLYTIYDPQPDELEVKRKEDRLLIPLENFCLFRLLRTLILRPMFNGLIVESTSYTLHLHFVQGEKTGKTIKTQGEKYLSDTSTLREDVVTKSQRSYRKIHSFPHCRCYHHRKSKDLVCILKHKNLRVEVFTGTSIIEETTLLRHYKTLNKDFRVEFQIRRS